ncbi:MAG: PEP-CTERM/exosortase system-associated acyltransferase [Pseudomonadota bacterium]
MTLVARKHEEFTDKNLSLSISRDEEHVARCQRLRYKVYCVERGWYDEVRIAKGHELDAFDDRANHALLTRNDTGESIGVVRLVLPTGDAAQPDLPIQEITPDPLTLIEEPVDMTRLAEVSRFAVTRDFKNWTPYPGDPNAAKTSNHRRFSMFSVLLMRSVVLMSRENGIEVLCATMEPSLILHLARMGIRFQPLGEPKEYHGVRQPCYARLSVIEEEMRQRRADIHPLVFP